MSSFTSFAPIAKLYLKKYNSFFVADAIHFFNLPANQYHSPKGYSQTHQQILYKSRQLLYKISKQDL